MRQVVLDASVVVKWFREERGSEAARELRRELEEGELRPIVPRLLFLELLNAAGRRWGWGRDEIHQLLFDLEDAGFDVVDPDLAGVADWVAEGLTAYDATYIAVAQDWRVPLVTDDSRIVALAPTVAHPLRA